MKGLRILLVFISSVFFLDVNSHQTSIDAIEIIDPSDPSPEIYNDQNYANQSTPTYIYRDNTPRDNPMNDTVAYLGRVLFYDTKLSANNTISCASCHKQEFAFGDDVAQSPGVSGVSMRHSMRLVNVRYGQAKTLFWDERAKSLEEQTTMPIKDHIEMGFSGRDGDPTFEDLIDQLQDIDYYQRFFTDAFGDSIITETRIQKALAQFVRSIQSFDSRYDEGRSQVSSNNTDFPNFTKQENLGKRLFMRTKSAGGANCQNCHRAPTFDIDPDSGNNGVFTVAGDPTAMDMTNVRSPSLRDLMNQKGILNGPMMHDGSLASLEAMIDHYDRIPNDPMNFPKLDSRLENESRDGGQRLQLTQVEKDALIAFLKTLTGSNLYVDPKWSDPFKE